MSSHISAPLRLREVSSAPITAMNTGNDVVATCTAAQPSVQQEGTAPGPARLLYPARFQRFDPKGPYNYLRYSRETIDEVTDCLKEGDVWKEQTLLKWSPQQQPLAMGATVNTKKLAELLVVGHCSARSLVVFLPPEFETHIAEMVSRKPEVCNSPTTDLLHNQTYLVFSAGHGDTASSLWIFDTQIYRDVGSCAGLDGEDEFLQLFWSQAIQWPSVASSATRITLTNVSVVPCRPSPMSDIATRNWLRRRSRRRGWATGRRGINSTTGTIPHLI